jgi:branched-chain amino acid transport system ATP-binding protein
VKDLIKEVADGRTVMMVEHNMSVVSGICDTITVIARGACWPKGRTRRCRSIPR